ncbi:MAG: right-handed parallel beta-helix repeat-containing protein [Acidobacteriia bacterium]|nr:right-handed parallel beta-helix repeat-containing protein [Terriglobia bacterium]
MKINVVKWLIFAALGTTMMYGQASRTWVSGVGDDANPCSRTAPCKTFAGAISKTAAGGEIDALDPAGYGAVTITKAITIDGGGGQVASVLVSGTNGIVVQANASTDVVILRNLRINGIGTGLNGIQFLSGKALGIENCAIFGFTGNGINVATAGGRVWVTHTDVTSNTGHGLSVVSTALTTVSIDGSHFELNNFGVLAGSNSKIVVTNSSASLNTFGLVAQPAAGTAELDVHNSTASNNTDTGIFSGGGAGTATIRMAATSIYGNVAHGIFVSTNGSILSFSNNFNGTNGSPSGTIPPQ